MALRDYSEDVSLKQERRPQGLFSDNGGSGRDDFGLVARNDFFGDSV